MSTRSMNPCTFRPTWRGYDEAERCSGALRHDPARGSVARGGSSIRTSISRTQACRAAAVARDGHCASIGYGGPRADVMRLYFESGGERVVRGASCRRFGPVSEARGRSNRNLSPGTAFRSTRPWPTGPYCGTVFVTRKSTVDPDGRGGGPAAVAAGRPRRRE